MRFRGSRQRWHAESLAAMACAQQRAVDWNGVGRRGPDEVEQGGRGGDGGGSGPHTPLTPGSLVEGGNICQFTPVNSQLTPS